jgi:hypothetical protein
VFGGWRSMTHHDEAVATDRLRRALLAFRTAQTFLLAAHRQIKTSPPAEMETFWIGPGRHIEGNMRATATEVGMAFKAFSATGLVADDDDLHRMTEARRYLAKGEA